MMWVIRGVFVLALLVITTLSILPSDYLPPQVFNLWDKSQHVAAYAVLAILGLGGFAHHRMTILIGLLLHGVLIELVQNQLGWRQGDGLDVVADGMGVLIGCLVFRFVITSTK